MVAGYFSTLTVTRSLVFLFYLLLPSARQLSGVGGFGKSSSQTEKPRHQPQFHGVHSLKSADATTTTACRKHHHATTLTSLTTRAGKGRDGTRWILSVAQTRASASLREATPVLRLVSDTLTVFASFSSLASCIGHACDALK